MSHTTTLKGIKIVDIAALEEAVEYIANVEGKKVSLLRNTRPRMYSREQEVMCDYVVKLPGPYDVGFERQSDGSYAPLFDSYLGHVRAAIGAPTGITDKNNPNLLNISKLVDLYGVHAAQNQLAKDGYGYESSITYCVEDNSYVLEVSAAY